MELTFSLCQSSQLPSIPKHIIQCHLSSQREFVISDFRIHDTPFPLINRANHRSLEFDGRDDLNGHNGLKDDGLRFGKSLAESANRSGSESQFGRIHHMRLTVFEQEATPGDRVTCQLTTVKRFLESLGNSRFIIENQKLQNRLTFSTAGINWNGMFPPTTRFSKPVSFPVSVSNSIGSMIPLTRAY